MLAGLPFVLPIAEWTSHAPGSPLPFDSEARLLEDCDSTNALCDEQVEVEVMEIVPLAELNRKIF